MFSQTRYSTLISPGGQEFAPTAADFLTIPTAADVFGMGYAGISTEPTPSSINNNPAPISLSSAKTFLELSFTPWQRALIAERSLTSLAAHKKLNDQNTLGATMQYFSRGTVVYTTSSGAVQQKRYFDLAMGMAWSRKINDNISYGLGLKFVNANVFPMATMDFDPERTSTLAGDMGVYYRNDIAGKEKTTRYALAISMSDFGPKFHLNNDVELFLPTLLQLGGSLQYPIVENHGLLVSVEAHKLMVPTRPRYAMGDSLVLFGKDPEVNFLKGIFQSFSDAPGISSTDNSYNTFKEELQEIMASFGIAYVYKKQYFARAGYFYQHAGKGNNGFVGFGAGYDLGGSRLSVAYMLPIDSNLFKNTWQVSFAVKLREKE
jgi:hypothetical protein